MDTANMYKKVQLETVELTTSILLSMYMPLYTKLSLFNCTHL